MGSVNIWIFYIRLFIVFKEWVCVYCDYCKCVIVMGLFEVVMEFMDVKWVVLGFWFVVSEDLCVNIVVVGMFS